MSDAIWGRPPVIGDKVYVDFGDSIIDGGEAIGWLKAYANDWFTLVDADGNVTERFHISEAAHIEVLEG